MGRIVLRPAEGDIVKVSQDQRGLDAFIAGDADHTFRSYHQLKLCHCHLRAATLLSGAWVALENCLHKP
jgi:hypothetical protein